jgi:hypothetical protein
MLEIGKNLFGGVGRWSRSRRRMLGRSGQGVATIMRK